MNPTKLDELLPVSHNKGSETKLSGTQGHGWGGSRLSCVVGLRILVGAKHLGTSAPYGCNIRIWSQKAAHLSKDAAQAHVPSKTLASLVPDSTAPCRVI